MILVHLKKTIQRELDGKKKVNKLKKEISAELEALRKGHMIMVHQQVMDNLLSLNNYILFHETTVYILFMHQCIYHA
jgi:hypothetical protein